MDYCENTSTNWSHPNAIDQPSENDDEETQLGAQATPSFDHLTEECANAGACAKTLHQEENSCNKTDQQAQDIDTHLSTTSIVPFDSEDSHQQPQLRDEMTDSSLTIVPSKTVIPLPSSIVQIDPNDTGEIPIYSPINVMRS
jgi:hypothetical protein